MAKRGVEVRSYSVDLRKSSGALKWKAMHSKAVQKFQQNASCVPSAFRYIRSSELLHQTKTVENLKLDFINLEQHP